MKRLGPFIFFALILLISAAITAWALWPETTGQAAAPAAATAAPAQERAARSTLLGNARSSVRACMNDGVLALLDIGERDLDLITDWAMRHCARRLAFYLNRELERPKGETDAYVLALVRREVEVLAKAPAP